MLGRQSKCQVLVVEEECAVGNPAVDVVGFRTGVVAGCREEGVGPTPLLLPWQVEGLRLAILGIKLACCQYSTRCCLKILCSV